MDENLLIQVDINPSCLSLDKQGIVSIGRASMEHFERIQEDVLVIHPESLEEEPELVWLLPDSPKPDQDQARNFIESQLPTLRRVMIGWELGVNGYDWESSMEQDACDAYFEVRSSIDLWYSNDFVLLPF